MVDLPPYVKGYRKPSGRVFFYYERYRNTDRAWPRISLPYGPQAPEFWQMCQRLAEVEAERADGDWLWTWAPKSGRRYSLPSPHSEGGIAAFGKAMEAAERREQSGDAADRKTFRGLVDLYQAHSSYLKLAPLTKVDYDRHLTTIADRWGDDPVADLTTVDAQRAIDSFQDAPTVARYFRAVLSRLIAFGIPRGFSTHNVVKPTEKVEHEAEPHDPWPDWAFELFFEHARPGLHLPVISAFYTGQRSIDVITMLRPEADAEAISLITRKTGGQVWRPIHSEYREILAAHYADTPALHLREDGTPWTLAGYRTAWQRDLTSINAKGEPTTASPAKKAAMKRIRDAGLVFHGIRKNAVNMLLETGCTEAEVSAIVEMSEQMVRHYSKDVNKRHLARSGSLKMEQGWLETRKRIFGKALAPALSE